MEKANGLPNYEVLCQNGHMFIPANHTDGECPYCLHDREVIIERAKRDNALAAIANSIENGVSQELQLAQIREALENIGLVKPAPEPVEGDDEFIATMHSISNEMHKDDGWEDCGRCIVGVGDLPSLDAMDKLYEDGFKVVHVHCLDIPCVFNR